MIVKFKVPFRDHRPIPDMPGLEVEGVLAIVQAETVMEARALLDGYCAETNQPKWSAVADVEILSSDRPQVFAYVG